MYSLSIMYSILILAQPSYNTLDSTKLGSVSTRLFALHMKELALLTPGR
jgi:hypothetical protein